MPLWICFAILSAVVGTLLLRSAGPTAESPSHDPDLDVYRDQIAELDADTERGVIDQNQAEAARTEIARRLIKQSELPAAIGQPRSAIQPASANRLLTICAAAIPAVSLIIYLGVGSPGLPGRPLAARLSAPPDPNAPIDMIAKVEARLREKPADAQGWAVIAPVYLSMGRAPDAANAFARAISLAGETPDRLLGLAKSNIMANNGIVNDPAQKALLRLKEIDPNRVEAQFWLAVYDEQNGRPEAAAATYMSMLKAAPADAPWRAAVEERLAAATGQPAPAQRPASPGGMTPPTLAPAASNGGDAKGPTPAQFVEAAKKLAPEMREQMIGRMVSKAADAVKQNPLDIAAWSRIVTGHAALDKPGEAKSALKEARQALSANPAATTELDALAVSLGLNS